MCYGRVRVGIRCPHWTEPALAYFNVGIVRVLSPLYMDTNIGWICNCPAPFRIHAEART